MAHQIELQQKDSKGKVLIEESAFNAFNDYLQLGSSTSASEVAIAISKLAPKPSGDEKVLDDGFFFGLWQGIIGVAEQIPYDHLAMDKLVNVMRELTLLPDTGITVWNVSVSNQVFILLHIRYA